MEKNIISREYDILSQKQQVLGWMKKPSYQNPLSKLAKRKKETINSQFYPAYKQASRGNATMLSASQSRQVIDSMEMNSIFFEPICFESGGNISSRFKESYEDVKEQRSRFRPQSGQVKPTQDSGTGLIQKLRRPQSGVAKFNSMGVSEMENCYTASQKSIKIIASSSKNPFDSRDYDINDGIRIIRSRFAEKRKTSVVSAKSDQSKKFMTSDPMSSQDFLRQLETRTSPEKSAYILKRVTLSYGPQLEKPTSEVDQKYQIYLKKIKALNQAKLIFRHSNKILCAQNKIKFIQLLKKRQQEVNMFENNLK